MNVVKVDIAMLSFVCFDQHVSSIPQGGQYVRRSRARQYGYNLQRMKRWPWQMSCAWRGPYGRGSDNASPTLLSTGQQTHTHTDSSHHEVGIAVAYYGVPYSAVDPEVLNRSLGTSTR